MIVIQVSRITTVEAGPNVDTCFVSHALVAYTDRTYGTLSTRGRIKRSLHMAHFVFLGFWDATAWCTDSID
jgi:hypothetical protein